MTRIGVSLLIIGAALTTGACAGGAASTLPVGAAAYEAVPEAVPADRSSGTIRVGDRLDVVSAWAKSPTIPGEPMTRGILTWERVR